jgi:uncharacterized membrane protein
LFIIFSFIGWIIDSAYRSIIEEKKWTSRTVIPLFAPIYGFGGISLVIIFTYLKINPVLQVIIGAMGLTLIEYIGGVICTKILKKKLWDYSKSRYNIHGHVDAIHAIYWVILSVVMRIIMRYIVLV